MVTASIKPRHITYPTSDGKPMAETELHRLLMVAAIDVLEYWYRDRADVCVSGNLLMFYVPGNRRRHVSPDVFVAFGVRKKIRDNYVIWEEGKNPSVVIEVTSSSTKSEDTRKKFVLYRDTLKVKEYFLFDPRADYLQPRLKGYRLRAGKYLPIKVKAGRLPSKMLQLHLEAVGQELRFFDPTTERWLPTPKELLEQERQRADTLAEENERLRRLLRERNGH